MKTSFFLMGGLALLTMVSGCQKSLLDVDTNGTVQTSQYFTNLDQCNTSTQVAYRYIDWDSWWQIFNWRYLAGEAASDNAWIGNTYQSTHATYDAVSQYVLDAGNDRCEDQWIMLYKGIGIFNNTIEGIQGAPIDTASKMKFIGELKFLRSWCYFDLVRNYGGVPIVLKTYPASTHLPRNTVNEVYDQLINDLKECATILPRKSAYSAADICLYGYVHSAREGGFDLDRYPAVQRWLEIVRSQPGHITIDAHA